MGSVAESAGYGKVIGDTAQRLGQPAPRLIEWGNLRRTFLIDAQNPERITYLYRRVRKSKFKRERSLYLNRRLVHKFLN